ncbi:hypothetical protein PHYBLDRAFT_169929 [Phycomyces blakesleeanus NRRL 1555(-)]|uniref:Uncharacterized protein n=1 Tax=Phycomyces blakesleeanus (strain ATCC 8743b / DSM 1359 / FGSC 10004 / NBRC 33097 / NRRL 1555) TaxID=763407 RepID=A0A167M7C7_PHYB8|nr:hypothetical protein PHYBLDRAFT_169929 [Phycomyces blakesleeanus NRRL 1555(-)]OAD72024.1 hypothetical protein PHYBLDRAFT_169929 [Phycomyces blakesleeanus NRRL 1555(-)]|eukprot:XP_018290064.1 hypothetical protein PHYBLDRAFT_169929 [Phycomyces blakesleeanus NRRL 1555(-)]
MIRPIRIYIGHKRVLAARSTDGRYKYIVYGLGAKLSVKVEMQRPQGLNRGLIKDKCGERETRSQCGENKESWAWNCAMTLGIYFDQCFALSPINKKKDIYFDIRELPLYPFDATRPSIILSEQQYRHIKSFNVIVFASCHFLVHGNYIKSSTIFSTGQQYMVGSIVVFNSFTK